MHLEKVEPKTPCSSGEMKKGERCLKISEGIVFSICEQERTDIVMGRMEGNNNLRSVIEDALLIQTYRTALRDHPIQ